MKKKLLCVLLSTAMVAACLTGCSGQKSDEVLNIYCWNDEFQRRVQDHYPGYEIIDEFTGKIGDITVQWNQTPNQDNAYQTNLDEDLREQADADMKIDIFLVEADYAGKYVNTDYTMSLSELGITDADLADQYQYTKDAVTDENGNLKGASWQGCPALLIYNREIAKEVLGTDDPDKVQNFVKDWATYTDTAKKLQAAGYSMTASVNDTYRVYSNNVSSRWVEDGVINVDKNLLKWVEDSKALVDAGCTKTYGLWSDEWSAGFKTGSDVFCYFGPAWFIDFSMGAGDEGTIATAGGWGACTGPQSYFWSGTWICPATGTDNPELVKELILTMTTDPAVLEEILVDDNDFVNNKPLMDAKAADQSYQNAVLGGQNHLGLFTETIEEIDFSNISAYDQACNEEFQNAMKGYFDGQYATVDDALAAFYAAVQVKHPELVAPSK